jgi:hypothetical protein
MTFLGCGEEILLSQETDDGTLTSLLFPDLKTLIPVKSMPKKNGILISHLSYGGELVID